MKQGQKRTFSNPNTLKEMLELFNEGWSLANLKKRYSCDHSSLNYQIEKHFKLRLKKGLIKKSVLPKSPYGESLKLKTSFEEVDELGEPCRVINNYESYYEKDRKKRKEEAEKYLKLRQQEEQRKSHFCTNPDEVLIRIEL